MTSDSLCVLGMCVCCVHRRVGLVIILLVLSDDWQMQSQATCVCVCLVVVVVAVEPVRCGSAAVIVLGERRT